MWIMPLHLHVNQKSHYDDDMIIKFQLQSQFQRFLNQTLCVFSQMKDIKHIRQDFHLATRVMPQEWDLGHCGGLGRSKKIPKFNQIWCVSYLHECHMQLRHFFGPCPLGPWGGAKRANIIKSELQSQFLGFLKPNFVYLLTNERYITYKTGFSFGRLGHAPGVGLAGTRGDGGQTFLLLNSTSFGV